ncbi:MAG: hypothetical protein KC944_13350 [Candidatus Omnitrophica bacterium]|nr:hypothetical protein [Candidatus Omnitrophota bacterium]
MRPLPLLCLLLSSSVCPFFASATDWQPYGPPGGAVRALVSDAGEQTHFAICSEQVYQSTDQGLSWNPLAPPDSYQTYADGVVVGSETPTLLVCLDTGGIRRWNPSAQSWETANNGLGDPGSYALQGFDLSIAEPNATRVFFGSSVGLYYTDNNGGFWTEIPYPNDSYLPTKVQAASDGSVFIYTYTPIRIAPNLVDTSFFVAKPGLPTRALDQAMIWPNPSDPMELLLTFPYYPTFDVNSVYYSADGGENWTQPSLGAVPTDGLKGLWLGGSPVILGASGTYVLDDLRLTWSQGFDFGRKSGWSLLKLPGADRYLRGSQDRGVWRTVDGGAIWDYSSEGMNSYGDIRAMATHLSEQDTLYVAVSQSVWKTVDDGLTWQELNNGLKADGAYGFSIRSLAIDPNDPLHLIAGSEVTGGLPASLYQSFDGGESWTPAESGPTNICVKIHFVKGASGVVLAGTLGQGVWRSTNNGTSWSSDAVFPQYSNITDIVQESGGRLFACQTATFNTQGGVYISDNGGESWTFSEASGGFRHMAADPLVGGKVMGGYEAGGPYITTDNGLTWNLANTGLPGYAGGYGAIEDLIAHPSVSDVYYIALAGYGVYETQNAGGEWKFLDPEMGDPDIRAPLVLSTRDEGTMFAADRGVYASKLEVPIVDLPDTPTPTTTQVIATPTPTNPSPPPTWFPGPRTPTPTPVQSVNVGMTIWGVSVAPKSPSTTGNVTVGIVLYNDSRVNLENVGIDAYWSKDGGAFNHFARMTLPTLRLNSEVEVPSVGSFQPSEAGTYTVQVKIDNENAIEESNELDNDRQTSFYVRAGGVDTTPPTGDIMAAGGSPFTSSWDVYLNLPATDAGSGVAFMRIEAFFFNPYSGGLGSYFDSGWIDYQSGLWFSSLLIFTGDIDAYAVNYADWEGNISPTYWTAVTYCQTQFTEFVFYDEIVYYPFYLQYGQKANITLNNVYGDADLFVVAPSDPPGYASWFSQNDGIASENISITGYEEGVYWIGVFGYDWSEYRLLCSGGFKGMESPKNSQRKDRRGPEIDTPGNGTLIARGISVPTLGVDFDGNGVLNSLDLFYLATNWGMKSGDPGYDARCGALAPEERVGSKHLLRWMSGKERR